MILEKELQPFQYYYTIDEHYETLVIFSDNKTRANETFAQFYPAATNVTLGVNNEHY